MVDFSFVVIRLFIRLSDIFFSRNINLFSSSNVSNNNRFDDWIKSNSLIILFLEFNLNVFSLDDRNYEVLSNDLSGRSSNGFDSFVLSLNWFFSNWRKINNLIILLNKINFIVIVNNGSFKNGLVKNFLLRSFISSSHCFFSSLNWLNNFWIIDNSSLSLDDVDYLFFGKNSWLNVSFFNSNLSRNRNGNRFGQLLSVNNWFESLVFSINWSADNFLGDDWSLDDSLFDYWLRDDLFGNHWLRNNLSSNNRL
jgi:hypothetical protein